jgi:hypothetical protein
MSTTKKANMFNLNPLVIEVEEVIKNGLNKILVDYMDRYELLEDTHNQIMRLPSIRQALNKNSEDSDSEDFYKIDNFNTFVNNICDKSKVNFLQCRLDTLEKKYDTILPILDKILNKIISLDHDVKSLKSCENISPIKTSICNLREKENIKIHFEEPSEELVEEEESDEEDVNPALIKEPEKVSQDEIPKSEEELFPSHETAVNLEEEDDELLVEEELGEHEEHVKEESEAKPDDNLAGDVEVETKEGVEEECEEVEEGDVEDNVEEESEAKSDDNSDGDVEEQSETIIDAVVNGDVEDEVSIETETKSEVEEDEEDNEDKEEEEVEPEPESVKQVVEEADDEELFEIEIDDKTYCTTDDQNGFIWELTEDGEQGEKIGYLKDGDAFFYEDEN